MDWFLKNHGIELKINPSDFPISEEVSFDVETDEKDNVVSVAVCGSNKSVSVYFGESLQFCYEKLKTKKLIAHQARADVKWLERYGITMKHITWDTMLADYVISSTQDSFGLKDLAWKWLSLKWPTYKEVTTSKEFIQMACTVRQDLLVRQTKMLKKGPKETIKQPKKLTLDKLPREIVANYNGWDAYATFMLRHNQKLRATSTAMMYMEKIEFPTSQLLYEVEKKGIKMDIVKLVQVHKKFLKESYIAKKQFARLAGKDVLISSPLQVLAALRRCGLPVSDTNEDTLVPYKNDPLVKHLLAYRGASKICSTYTKPLYKRAIQDIQNRVYPTFLQHTETGRLACRNPNLQNQPPELRECFIAEDGTTFNNGDWSQVELRIPAHFSEEPLMMDTFINNKKKIHQVTADEVGVSYKVGKTINFLLTNSGGPKRLAEIAEIPVAKAEEAMARFKERFHVLFSWIEEQKAFARQKGGATTLYGRFVPLPEIRSRDFKLRGYAERQALSVKVQGSAADMMKAAMLKLWYKYGLVPVVTVHDEVMYEEPINNTQIVQCQMREVMESIVKLKVPLIADIAAGNSWATAKKKD